MIFFKAQQMQQLAELLLELERSLEREGGEPPHELVQRLDVEARNTGIPLDLLRLSHPDTLEEILAPGGSGDPGRMWGAAELLYLDGLLALAEGDSDQAADRLGKAERLYRRVEPGLELPEGAVPLEERRAALRELLP